MESESNAPAMYMIRSQANPDLVLGAFNGQVVIEWIDLNNPSQRWYRIGEGFTNMATGGSIGVVSVAAGQRLQLHNQHTDWTIAGSSIQPKGHPELFVTIDGGGNLNLGTPAVLATNVSQPWQKWDVVPASAIQPPATRTIQLLCDPALALTAEDSRYTLKRAVFPPPARALYTLVTWSKGYALYSEVTKRFLGFAGVDRTVVGYPQMCVEALWSLSNLDRTAWARVSPWGGDNLLLHVVVSGTPVEGADINVIQDPGHPIPSTQWEVY